jgi:prevent-host-death family protein
MSGDLQPQVGIRELKEHASALIRRVAAGETITITDRGRPVARIVPLHQHPDRDMRNLATVEVADSKPVSRSASNLVSLGSHQMMWQLDNRASRAGTRR